MPENVPNYTIVLFGETGAGKSTTINAFFNYARFPSFKQAEAGTFQSFIPYRLTLPDPNGSGPITFKDDTLNDGNENYNDDGASVTQEPRRYELKFDNRTVTIIDTPGMGDTGGLDVDKKNFQNILNYLEKEIKSVTVLCFLIKTVVTRKTAVFQYTLNQLLYRLNEDACKNLIFCFTFSRNSFYGPGDGFETLRAHLNETGFDKKLQLKTGTNCFFIDNEAYHYLVAKKHNYQFPEEIRESYKESWNKSVEQFGKMIKVMEGLTPIPVFDIFKPIPEPESDSESETESESGDNKKPDSNPRPPTIDNKTNEEKKNDKNPNETTILLEDPNNQNPSSNYVTEAPRNEDDSSFFKRNIINIGIAGVVCVIVILIFIGYKVIKS